MIEEGVYILEGSYRTGTGATAGSQQTHRSLWATVAVSEDSAKLVLLDDKGQPTGLVETVSLQQLKGAYRHRPLSAATWGRLRDRVQAACRPKPVPKPAPAAPPSTSGPQAAAPPQGPAKTEPAPNDPFDTTPWWDQSRK